MRLEVWIPALIAFLSFLGSIAGYYAQRRLIAAQALKTRAEANEVDAQTKKTEAEAADIISEAWQKLNNEHKAEITSLNSQIATLRKQIARLEKRVAKFDEILSGAHKLHGQLVSRDITPVWDPPDRREIESAE